MMLPGRHRLIASITKEEDVEISTYFDHDHRRDDPASDRHWLAEVWTEEDENDQSPVHITTWHRTRQGAEAAARKWIEEQREQRRP